MTWLFVSLLGVCFAQIADPSFTGCTTATGAACSDASDAACTSALTPSEPCSELLLDAAAAAASGLKAPCAEASGAACALFDAADVCRSVRRPAVACSRRLVDLFDLVVLFLSSKSGQPVGGPGFAGSPSDTKSGDYTKVNENAMTSSIYPFAQPTGPVVDFHPPNRDTTAGDAFASGLADSSAVVAAGANERHTEVDSQHTKQTAMLSSRDLATYLSISAGVLVVLCAMGAFMTWKALENKRRRIAGELDDDDDVGTVDDTIGGDTLLGGSDLEAQTHDSLDLGPAGGREMAALGAAPSAINDDELRWNGAAELSPISSDLQSLASPYDPNSPPWGALDLDVNTLLDPAAAVAPAPLAVDEPAAATAAAAASKKRSFDDTSTRSSPERSSASTSREPSPPAPLTAPAAAPPRTTAQKAPRRGKQSGAPSASSTPAATKSAIAAFMSGGAQAKKLSYETRLPAASATASASSSAKTSAKTTPLESTPSPQRRNSDEDRQQQQQPAQVDAALTAFSNIKLLAT